MSIINYCHELSHGTDVNLSEIFSTEELKELDFVARLIFKESGIFTENTPKVEDIDQRTIFPIKKEEQNEQANLLNDLFNALEEKEEQTISEIEYPTIVHKIIFDGVITQMQITSKSDQRRLYEMYVELTSQQDSLDKLKKEKSL